MPPRAAGRTPAGFRLPSLDHPPFGHTSSTPTMTGTDEASRKDRAGAGPYYLLLICTRLMFTGSVGKPSPGPFWSSSPPAAIFWSTSRPAVTLPNGV